MLFLLIYSAIVWPERARNPFSQIFLQIFPVQTPANSPVRITLPFKDQKSADVVRRRLGDFGTNINQQLQPVFTSKKIANHLKVTEEKPPLINQQSVVYEFTCDLCHKLYWVHLPPSPSTRRGT